LTAGGNYTFGIKEQVIFPEIQYDKVEKVRGMDVTWSPPPGRMKRASSC